jgi:hypothetical protein
MSDKLKTLSDEILVNVYGRQAPKAARFGVGAQTLRDVEEATQARRDLSEQQSTTTRGPVRRD